MAVKKTKNNIEIERNVIEQYLMLIKEFVKNNGHYVKYILTSIIILIVLSVGIFIYIDRTTTANYIKYEKIIDSYRSNPENRVLKDKTINELRELVKNSSFGHAHQMSFYMLGNLLYEDEKFAEAYDMFKAFIKKSSSKEIFIPIAVNKASICLEEQGKFDDAISLLLKFEEDNKDSILLDQVLYNAGRLYAIKEDRAKAMEYFNKVITAFPDSVFSERSRERLFLLGRSK